MVPWSLVKTAPCIKSAWVELPRCYTCDRAGQNRLQQISRAKRKHQYISRAALQIFSWSLATLKQIFVNICEHNIRTIFARRSSGCRDGACGRLGETVALAPARERNSLKLQKNVRTKNTRPQYPHCHHCFCRPRMEHWKIFNLLPNFTEKYL